MTRRWIGRVAPCAVLAAVFLPAAFGAHERGAASFAVFEGTVVEIGGRSAEGGLEAISVRLDVGGASRWVVLGPAEVLDDGGFTVAAGDRLRVRVFVDPGDDPESAAFAQRVLNTTHRGMIRLRTLHRQPLWDAGPAPDRGRSDLPERPRPDRSPGRGGGGGGSGR